MKNTIAFNDGVTDYGNNCYARNPYRENTDSHSEWEKGFGSAHSASLMYNDICRSEIAIAKFNKWVDAGAPSGI